MSRTSKNKDTSSTAVAREAQLAPVVAAIFVLCFLAGLRPLVATAVHIALEDKGALIAWVAWAIAFVFWLGPVVSDLRYWITHRTTSVGMAPPAVASLAAPCIVTLAYAHPEGSALVALWVVLGVSLAITIGFVAGFVRLRMAYAHAAKPAGDAVVIVLGGTIRDGKPLTTLVLRLQKAARVWEESPERTLLLTGGPVPGDTRCEADYMQDALSEMGVPSRSMLLERRARNTTENMQYSLELLAQLELDRQLCVLSSDFHLYRALREGRAFGVELIPIASSTPRKSRLQQWCREILTALVLP